MSTRKISRIATAILLTIPAHAFSAEDAGRLEKRFERPPEPLSTPKPLMLPIQEQLPPEQASAIRFTLKELRISGNTAFDDSTLKGLASELLGKEVSLADIYALRSLMTKQYGDAGYSLSRAVIPAQRIQSDGIVEIQIIEGFVDEVIIEGASDLQRDFLEYAATQIKAERPLNVKTLERYLLLANDRYAIEVTSTMRASDSTPEASTLILKVEQASRFNGGASIDNRGTTAVGKTQLNADISVNGLFGMANRTTLGYATVEQADELQYASLTHNAIASHEGTSLTFRATRSTSEPGLRTLRLLEQESESLGFSVKASHPFIRSRQENLSSSIELESKDTENRSLGATTSEDKIRSLRLALNYDNADRYSGINQALIELSQGLDSLGAMDDHSTKKSRTDGKPDYTKVTVSLSRQQELNYFSPLLNKFSVSAALMGQYSGDGLLSSEECGIGGTQFGRAYDSSEITGDKCIAGSLELRYTTRPESFPQFKYTQFYTFYDGGRVSDHEPLSVGAADHASLSSSGIGVRYGLGEHMSGSFEFTKPLTRDVANEGDDSPRIFANFSVRF